MKPYLLSESRIDLSKNGEEEEEEVSSSNGKVTSERTKVSCGDEGTTVVEQDMAVSKREDIEDACEVRM